MPITGRSDAARGGAPGAVLWDLDGTLADSREYHWQAWRDTMASLGVVLTEAQFAASFGQRNDRILATWVGDVLPAAEVQRVGDEKEALYRRLIRQAGIQPLRGAAEWVRALAARGWRQAIASSAPRENVVVMADALGFIGLIDAFVGAEDVRAGKPAPDVFLRAAELVGVPPERCVVVEDAEAGVAAARRAGMRAIGVGGGSVAAADLLTVFLDELPDDAFERLIATFPAAGSAGTW
jgi:beta-phosphoglucomutase